MKMGSRKRCKISLVNGKCSDARLLYGPKIQFDADAISGWRKVAFALLIRVTTGRI